MSTLNDNLASCIIAGGIFFLFIVIGVWAYLLYDNHTSVQRIELEFVPTDSAMIVQTDKSKECLMLSKGCVDSIINRIELHEAQLAQKYQYILEKRDEEDNYRNVIMFIFGIVASVVGFFGYRSFADIAEDAKTTAETKAEEIATSIATEIANSTAEAAATSKATEVATAYCSRHIPGAVASYLNANLQNLVNSRVTSIFDNEGRASIIREISVNLNASITTHIDQYIHSDNFKSLVYDAVERLNAHRGGNEEDTPEGDGANQASGEDLQSGDREVPVEF